MTGVDVLPTRNLRTRAGRAARVSEAVASAECRLPGRARLLVHGLACCAALREPVDFQTICKWLDCSERTARKTIALLASACGEDPFAFVVDVVERRRSPDEWFRALELHGGRHGA